jgi:hypothetical protein
MSGSDCLLKKVMEVFPIFSEEVSLIMITNMNLMKGCLALQFSTQTSTCQTLTSLPIHVPNQPSPLKQLPLQCLSLFRLGNSPHPYLQSPQIRPWVIHFPALLIHHRPSTTRLTQQHHSQKQKTSWHQTLSFLKCVHPPSHKLTYYPSQLQPNHPAPRQAETYRPTLRGTRSCTCRRKHKRS